MSSDVLSTLPQQLDLWGLGNDVNNPAGARADCGVDDGAGVSPTVLGNLDLAKKHVSLRLLRRRSARRPGACRAV